jgi:ribosomal protein S18 acetylase RimI-like enzyme
MDIRPYDESNLEAVVRLSLRAWAPVFESIERALDPDVYREHYPDWRVTQREAVEAVCADARASVWVAVADGAVAGFAALKLHEAERMGEIYMIAVDPDYQRRGIAKTLTAHAMEQFREAGMTTAMVETGGDPGHEAARRTYEAAGFQAFPSVRYFRKVDR